MRRWLWLPVVVSLASTVPFGPHSLANSRASGWRLVKAPNVPSGELLAVAGDAPDDVWAVGDLSPQGSFKTLALHWDGVTWQRVPTPSVGDWNMLRAVAVVSKTDAWAVGFTVDYTTLIEHWDGTSWTMVDSPVVKPNAALYGVAAVTADNVWAVGSDGEHGSIVHWDGTQWRAVAHPEPPGSTFSALQNVTATSADDVWAVGDDIAQTNDPMVLHFDGQAWSAQPTQRRGEYVYVSGVGASSGTDAWFAGWWSDQATNPLVEHWDGSSWMFEPAVRDIIPVRVVSISANDAWISGYRGFYHAATEHWDGTSWTPVHGAPIGTGDSELYGLGLIPGGGLWAVGEFEPNGVVQPLLEFNSTP